MQGLDDPSKRRAAAFEFEACDAADEAYRADGGMAAQGARLPVDVMLNWDMRGQMIDGVRTYNTTDDASIVPTEYLAGSFIDMLRKQTSILRAGARILSGLRGSLEIPKRLTGASATWVSAEHGDATVTEGTFGLVTMAPKDLAAYSDFSRRMMQQSSPDIEHLARVDLVEAFSIALDKAAIEGAGSSGVPKGVKNITGVNKPTEFAAAAPTWAEVIAMETALADDEALRGNLSYIGRTNMRGALKSTPKVSGYPEFIMNGDGTSLNGYPYIDSNNITDGLLYFGNWSDVLLGFWSGLDVRVSDEALLLKGGRRIVIFQTADVAVRHAESFAWNGANTDP